MDQTTLIKYLTDHNKQSLLSLIEPLLGRTLLDQQILNLNLPALERQADLLNLELNSSINLKPYSKWNLSGSALKKELGLKLLKQGKCASLLIAGGQGTRLNYSAPKGTFPVTLIQQKSLFQFFAEKVLAASHLVKKDLPFAIMTSPLNDKETRAFFQNHSYFGLKEHQVYFFSQKMLPFLDFDGKLFLESEHQMALGPDGNGGCFENLFDSNIGETWKSLGIEYIHVSLIDNPLADPFDLEMLGEFAQSDCDIVLKGCLRKSSDEKVGIFAQIDNKLQVIEYHEIPSHFKPDSPPCANLSLFTLKMDFAKEMSKQKLPLHKVKKKASYYDETQKETITPKQENAWKFEQYLFDILPFAKHPQLIVADRQEIFSPLKNATGEGSISCVQQDLLNKERKMFESLCGQKAPDFPFELSPQFYYPTTELTQRWQEQKPSSPYLS